MKDPIDHGFDNAENDGLALEKEYLVYTGAMLLYGVDFEDTPEPAWARAILEDRSVPSEQRVLLLQERFFAAIEARKQEGP